MAVFRASNERHMPTLRKLLEQRCAGARLKALTSAVVADEHSPLPLVKAPPQVQLTGSC